ncbi:MAG: hypothetical protein IPM29_19820 [Planctomycetes bacterium]|nr:hypothetical protein [Planctomycetota bacterium]
MNSVILMAGLLLLCSPMTAQRTWIVDARGGPGVDFTDIPPAVSASAPNDMILVRNAAPATYRFPQRVTRGVWIVGDPLSRPTIAPSGTSVVEDLPAGETFLVANLDVPYGSGLRAMHRCRGSVALWNVSFMSSSLECVDCDSVSIHHTDIQILIDNPRARFERSHVVLSDCIVWSELTLSTSGIGTLRLIDSTLDLTDTLVYGASVRCEYGTNIHPAHAIVGTRSRVWIRGASRIRGGETVYPCQSTLQVDAFACDIPPVVDPTVVISPSSSWSQVYVAELAAVHPGPISPGQTQWVDVTCPTGSVATLLASLPTGVGPLELSIGDLWVHPEQSIVVGSQPVSAIRRATFLIPVPAALPAPLPLIYQVASLDPLGSWQLGNPGVGLAVAPF